MNQNFNEQFNKFCLQIYYYNSIRNTTLDPEVIKFEQVLKLIIPIFYRILYDDNIDIIEKNHMQQKYNTINNVSYNENWNKDSISNNIDNEIDEEGNDQVNLLTNKSLEILEKIKLNSWALTEEHKI